MELNPLRLFQVATFYPQAINALYERHPNLVTASFNQQLNVLFQDGFGAVHILAPYLTERGYDTFWTVANCKPLQAQWLHDNGHTLANVDPRAWLFETVRRQIETFQPDIFYTLDPITFDSKFIHSLHHRPRVVIGWRAADIPPSTDWSEFDLIISPLEKLRQAAIDLGATAAANFFPGFPKRIYENVKDKQPSFDISFCGQWTEQQHTARNEYLSHVAQIAGRKNKFSCAYYLSGEIDKIPPVVQSWNQGARFGTDMYRGIRTGRIGLDARANHRLFVAGKKQDIGGNETANMRIIETVGCGVFLLAEHHENLQSMFEIGTEIETFHNKRELVDKIEYYLVHPEQRELIARRGQDRCFRDHSMTKRVREFDAIVRKYLKSKNEPPSLSETVKMPIIKKRNEDSKSGDHTNMAEFDVKQITDLAFAEFDNHNFQNALELFDQAVSIRPDISELNYGKAIAQTRLGLVDEAIETLQHLLSVLPDYENAKYLLAKLQSMVSPHQNVEPSSSGTHQEIRQLIEQAQTYINNGDWVEAMHAAEKAVGYGQTIPNLHYLRMLCLNAVGRHEEALEAAKAELTINPEHPAARAEFERLSEALRKTTLKSPNPEQRLFKSQLAGDLLYSIQKASHNFTYRGIPLIKNPFDFALYSRLLWDYKPKTIIEIGSKDGGGAIWLADLLQNFQIDGHVYSIDIVKPKGISHQRVTFVEGNGRKLQQTVTPEFMANIPRPLLVIEDADHQFETSISVLNFFHNYLNPEEYIIIEDGIISDLSQDPGYNSGPHRAIKEFLKLHPGEYDIDAAYCDFFGYNLTWCTNGFLKKKKYPINSAVPKTLISEFNADDPVPQGVVSQMSPNERFQLYYSLRQHLPHLSDSIRFVEIGSYAGASLLLTLMGLKRDYRQVHGFAIEPGGHPQFCQILKQLNPGDITHLQTSSHKAVPHLKKTFDRDGHYPMFIFVDGDHSYEGVRQDILDYYPLLSPSGIMMFHDFLPALTAQNREAIYFHHAGTEPGIRRACFELMEETFHCLPIELPLLYPTDLTQTQPHLPPIPGVISTIRAYQKPVE